MEGSWSCGMPRLATVVIVSAIGGVLAAATAFVGWLIYEERKDTEWERKAKVPG